MTFFRRVCRELITSPRMRPTSPAVQYQSMRRFSPRSNLALAGPAERPSHAPVISCDAPHPLALLRARRERQCGRRAAECSQQLPSSDNDCHTHSRARCANERIPRHERAVLTTPGRTEARSVNVRFAPKAGRRPIKNFGNIAFASKQTFL